MTFAVIIITLILLYWILCTINDMFSFNLYRERYNEIKLGMYSIRTVRWRIGDKFGYVALSSELEDSAVVFFEGGDIKIKDNVYYSRENIFNGPISYYYYRKYWALIKILVEEYNHNSTRTFISGSTRTFISGSTYNIISGTTGNFVEKKTFKFLK